MPTYTVRPGECLTKIAADHGFGDFKMIYDHPANAEFRKRRPDPHVIQAGDQVFIPETVPLKRTFATGKRHKVTIQRPRACLRVYVKDADGEPLGGKNYVLKVQGQEDKNGSTDGEGLAKEDIPATAMTACLEFPTEGFSLDLRLGNLDPLATSTGLAARLRNLGYACPATFDQGLMAERIRYALARLQADAGLEPSGELDADTRALLRDAHDHGENN